MAQENSTTTEEQIIKFDDYEVEYDAEIAVNDYHTAYLMDDKFVLSVFDSNEDRIKDTWLKYDSNGALVLEAYDSDYDGEIDTVNSIKNDEIMEKIKEPVFEIKEVVLPKNPNPEKEELNNLEKNQSPPKTAINQTDTETPLTFKLNPPPEKNKFIIPKIYIFGGLVILLGGLVYHLKTKPKK